MKYSKIKCIAGIFSTSKALFRTFSKIYGSTLGRINMLRRINRKSEILIIFN